PPSAAMFRIASRAAGHGPIGFSLALSRIVSGGKFQRAFRSWAKADSLWNGKAEPAANNAAIPPNWRRVKCRESKKSCIVPPRFQWGLGHRHAAGGEPVEEDLRGALCRARIACVSPNRKQKSKRVSYHATKGETC